MMKRISMKLLLILFLLIIFTTGLPVPAFSTNKITTVEGIIENVPDDTIVVRNRRYTITGLPLLKPSLYAKLNMLPELSTTTMTLAGTF